jgi:hypothetical protein
MLNPANATQTASNLVPFDGWLSELGKTRCTGWRWRDTGIVVTVNIHGRHYITREEIARFEARAMAGDFAKTADTTKATQQRRTRTEAA